MPAATALLQTGPGPQLLGESQEHTSKEGDTPTDLDTCHVPGKKAFRGPLRRAADQEPTSHPGEQKIFLPLSTSKTFITLSSLCGGWP